MKTISDNLKNSLAKKTPTYKKTVYLYKRFWNGSSYVYDSAIDITDEVKSYGDLLWKLDNEGFNVWNLSNTTLVLRNEHNQWLEGNTKGFFTSNYLINQSKIKIKVGAELADGTTEELYAFSGYISGSPNYDTEGKNAIITLISAMSIFDKFNAEDISTSVTEEVLGSDSGSVFTTAQNGVGIVLEMKKGATPAAAAELKANLDYSLTDLNTKGTPLTVTLVTDLTAGENLYCSYKYWYADKTIEWIIEEIMTLCGITSYSISPAIFESSIQNIWTQNTQAHWSASTLVNTEATSIADSFKKKWMPTGEAFVDPSETHKTHRVRLLFSGTGGAGAVYNFRRNDPYSPTRNYSLVFTAASNSVRFCITDGLMNIVTVLGTVISPMPSGYHEYKMESDISTNTYKIWYDGVLKLTIVDTTFTGYIGNGVGFYSGGGSVTFTRESGSEYLSFALSGTGAFDGASTATLTSIVHDLSVAMVSFGVMKNTYSLNGGTVTIETYTSDTSDFSAGNDPQGWIALDGTGLPQSAIKRYIKARITLTSSGLDSPQFDEFQVYYYTSEILISLVNLTGMTCRQALELLAAMPNYEIVFDTEDKFYFRERLTGLSSVLDIKGEDNLKNLTNYNLGVDRIYNHVTAEFGDYKVISDASGDTDPNSITNYGTRQYSIASTQLLPAENANIAYAIAPTILGYTKLPRKRCQIETQFLPQLELGDKITLFYEEPVALRRWKWGDKDVVYGQADLEYHNNDNLKNRYNFWDIDMRIEGIRLNLNNYITNFDLVEVL